MNKKFFLPIPMRHLDLADIKWLYKNIQFAAAEKEAEDSASVVGFFVWTKFALNAHDLPSGLKTILGLADDSKCELTYFERNAEALAELPDYHKRISEMKYVWLDMTTSLVQQLDDYGMQFHVFTITQYRESRGDDAVYRVTEHEHDFSQWDRAELDTAAKTRCGFDDIEQMAQTHKKATGHILAWKESEFLAAIHPDDVVEFQTWDEARAYIMDNFVPLRIAYSSETKPVALTFYNEDAARNGTFIIDPQNGEILENCGGDGFHTEENAVWAWNVNHPDKIFL